jgi:hypothetical protein
MSSSTLSRSTALRSSQRDLILVSVLALVGNCYPDKENLAAKVIEANQDRAAHRASAVRQLSVGQLTASAITQVH